MQVPKCHQLVNNHIDNNYDNGKWDNTITFRWKNKNTNR